MTWRGWLLRALGARPLRKPEMKWRVEAYLDDEVLLIGVEQSAVPGATLRRLAFVLPKDWDTALTIRTGPRRGAA